MIAESVDVGIILTGLTTTDGAATDNAGAATTGTITDTDAEDETQATATDPIPKKNQSNEHTFELEGSLRSNLPRAKAADFV